MAQFEQKYSGRTALSSVMGNEPSMEQIAREAEKRHKEAVTEALLFLLFFFWRLGIVQGVLGVFRRLGECIGSSGGV